MWRYRIPIGIGFTTAVLFVLLLFGAASWRGYDRSEFLALGQLVMDILTFPVTVWGFLFVIHEFRKSEAKPQVDLFFGGNTKEIQISAPSRDLSEVYVPFDLVLINTGQALARWYSVEIAFPYIVYVQDNLILLGVAWQKGIGRWTTASDVPGYTKRLFWSDGEIAIYLEQPVTIVSCYLRMNYFPEHKDRYEVPYKIVSDWGKPVTGNLVIQVK